MDSAASPVKAQEPFTMCTSTPKTTQLKLSSGNKDSKENTSDVSDSRVSDNVSKATENRVETPLSDKSSTSSSSEKQKDTPRKRLGKQTQASPSPNNETTKSESSEKRDTLTKNISPVNKPTKQNKVPEKHMSPVVVLKSSDIVSTDRMRSANISGEKARGGARRTIDLHSDGNESDEDSRGNREDSEFLVEGSSPIRRIGSDIIETFSIDSDSEDESFAPMQAAVDDLLTDLPVEETQSPLSSPKAKKTSPKKATSRRSKKKSTSDDRKHDDTNDDDTDGRVGDSSDSIYNKPKTAEEKFDELLGFSNGI